MKKGITVIENVVNCPVVQMSGRAFPGVVIQGDSLCSLYIKADKIFQNMLVDGATNLDDIEFIRDSLRSYLSIYESTLQDRGIDLPYIKPLIKEDL
jgi:hypothetical protein